MKILFYGDSVTECNRDLNDPSSLGDGYVMYTSESLKNAFEEIEFEFVNRGISGNRSIDLVNRLDNDVIAHQPDIVTVLIGVNDSWRRFDMNDPTTAEQFRENYETVLKRIKTETKAKIIMLEPFLMYGMGRDEYRIDLNEKIDVTRLLAKKYADFYIPLDGMIAAASVEYEDATVLSADGIHLADEGKKLVAWHLLQVLYDLVAELNEGSESIEG